jgi:hypothetical protein
MPVPPAPGRPRATAPPVSPAAYRLVLAQGLALVRLGAMVQPVAAVVSQLVPPRGLAVATTLARVAAPRAQVPAVAASLARVAASLARVPAASARQAKSEQAALAEWWAVPLAFAARAPLAPAASELLAQARLP